VSPHNSKCEASQALTHTRFKQFGANKATLNVGSTYFANKAGTVNAPQTLLDPLKANNTYAGVS
jgi:hypothetical protein